MKRGSKNGDTKVVASAELVLEGSGRQRGLKQILPFMGPAFIASIAYIDPGNFATNIQGGAEFGYILLWVVVASNLMAMLLQTLSAKLGIASGKNLAEHCRNQFPPAVVWVMWGVMEVVSMATDLAEFLGAALGFYLLFGVPLWIAAVLTAIITLLILGLEAYGFRPLEAAITAHGRRHCGLLSHRNMAGPPGLGSGCLALSGAAIFRSGERVPGHRYFGCNGHAACDFPAFVVDSGPDRHAGRGAASAIVSVRSSRRGDRDGGGGID